MNPGDPVWFALQATNGDSCACEGGDPSDVWIVLGVFVALTTFAICWHLWVSARSDA
jgi:hypothetical protein